MYRLCTRSCFTRRTACVTLGRVLCESPRFKMIFLARELPHVCGNLHFSHRVRCLTIGTKLNACRSYASHASILIECPFVELHHPIVEFSAELKYFATKKCGFFENKNRRNGGILFIYCCALLCLTIKICSYTFRIPYLRACFFLFPICITFIYCWELLLSIAVLLFKSHILKDAIKRRFRNK